MRSFSCGLVEDWFKEEWNGRLSSEKGKGKGGDGGGGGGELRSDLKIKSEEIEHVGSR